MCVQAARNFRVPVILDAGGVDAPIPPELLKVIDILSPNETELARLTNLPTESFEQISHAVEKCHEMVSLHQLTLDQMFFPLCSLHYCENIWWFCSRLAYFT